MSHPTAPAPVPHTGTAPPHSADTARTLVPVLVPLLLSAGLLLAGNGLTLTVVAVRAGIEGFGPGFVGWLGTAYFAGYLGGVWLAARLILRSGHIRVFAGLSALSALAALTMILWVDAWVWLVMRCLMGFAFCAITMVIESWLNAIAANDRRARILTLYRMVDLAFVTASQFLLPLAGPDGFEIFALIAMLFCLALLPVSLARLRNPPPPDQPRFRPRWTWALSPVACFGALTIGLTNSAFRSVGPVYAEGVGLTVDQVALFMSLGILGGALFVFPIGWLSDRIGRRLVLMLSTAGAAMASALLATAAPVHMVVFAGSFLFGGFALALYSLSIAHASDYAKAGEYVEVSTGLAFFFTIGASIGPFLASQLVVAFGPQTFFAYTGAVHLSLIAFLAWRMSRRAAVPPAMRSRFVALLRTSPALFGLARSSARGDRADPP